MSPPPPSLVEELENLRDKKGKKGRKRKKEGLDAYEVRPCFVPVHVLFLKHCCVVQREEPVDDEVRPCNWFVPVHVLSRTLLCCAEREPL